MTARRWLILIAALVLVAGAAMVPLLPQLIRQLAIARLQAMTGRDVAIDRIDLSLRGRRLVVHGLRVADRGEAQPLAALERLDVRVHLSSLLRGHVRIEELHLRHPTVHVVREPSGFNFSDLLRGSSPSGRRLDVSVDHLALEDGTVTFDDRALPAPQTWTSERIRIEARNLSTLRGDGTAVGSSLTAGAPVSLDMRDVRLYPIHFRATVRTEHLDVALARLYMPPGAAVIPERGRISTVLTAQLDAREGLRADLDARLEDLVLVTRTTRDPVLLAPGLSVRLAGLSWQEDQLRLPRFEVTSAEHPLAAGGGPAGRVRLSRLRATLSDITWPVTMPGRLDVSTSLASGGALRVAGTLRPPPEPSRIQLELSNLDLEPWGKLLPVQARVVGVADADLRIDEPLTGRVPTHVAGSIGISRVSVRDQRQELLAARRIEAVGLDLRDQHRLVIARLVVTAPRMIVERAPDGSFPIQRVLTRPAEGSDVTEPRDRAPGSRPASGRPVEVQVSDVVLRDGRVAWRDGAVTPPARIDVSNVQASARDVGWPLRGTAPIKLTARPAGGGQVALSGRVGLEPLSADVRVRASHAELSPYQPYAPTPARVGGRADLDLEVVVPPGTDARAAVRGRAAVSDLDVRDGERTVMRVERAAAEGIDVDWPMRLDVRSVALERPWILVERDESGRLPLRRLLPGASRGTPGPAAGTDAPAGSPAPSMTVSVTRLRVDGGGARVVDRSVAPPFAVDLDRLGLTVGGASTRDGAPAARVELDGRIGGNASIALRGTVAAAAPLRVDVDGELRRFAVPRANPYLLHEVAWQAQDGWVTTKLRCRIDGDALNARTDIRVGQLELARAGSHDQAEARIGLPLGFLVSLMKDSHGEIHVALPIGGRLSDPRFDFSEAIWSAVRRVAINAVTLPVSWIGRVRFSRDAKIERIDVDPIRFEAGTSALTDDGLEQVSRVSGFLRQTSEIRMALRPVVSARDRAAVGRAAVQERIDRVARNAHVSSTEAAARLYQERFPGRVPPAEPEAVLESLIETEPAPRAELRELAARRVDAVRGVLGRDGIDESRLVPSKPGEALDHGDARVELDLVERDRSPKPSSPFRQLLRRLSGEGRH